MSTISEREIGWLLDSANQELEQSPLSIANEPRCHAVVQEMLISGNCSSSPARSKRLAPLATGTPGEKMTIKEIIGVREMRARLASMGFREGNSVDVISTGGEGILIVLCGGIRLALDRSTAQKIIVSFTRESVRCGTASL